MLLKEKHIINFLTEKNETHRVKEVLIEILGTAKKTVVILDLPSYH